MTDYLDQIPLTKRLIERYEDEDHSAFPGAGKVNYLAVLTSTHTYLNEHVHPTVQARGALHDDGTYLTDHGPRHVETVMRRASKLARSKVTGPTAVVGEPYETPLTLYEIFLLVLAIHFHDVGNMYGREGHEKRILEAMKDVPPLGALGVHEQRLIAQIASRHGGTIEGEKDTIRSLPAGVQNNGDAHFRPQLLAAILRLADELADETERADDFGLRNPSLLPPTCLLYHKYAAALQVGVYPDTSRIALSFSVYVSDLVVPFQKKGASGAIEERYLLDEIYERTLKTYYEMVYCDRYMAPLGTRLVEVGVKIEVFNTPHDAESRQVIQYVLGDSAYPRGGASVADSLKSLLRDKDIPPNGRTMAAQLGNQTKGDS